MWHFNWKEYISYSYWTFWLTAFTGKVNFSIEVTKKCDVDPWDSDVRHFIFSLIIMLPIASIPPLSRNGFTARLTVSVFPKGKESNNFNFQSHKNLTNGVIADFNDLILRWITPLIKSST